MAKVHIFDVALAEKYGPIESIILSNLCFWIEKNQHNRKNYHKGRYWVYNSTAAFEKIFSYLNKDQIRRVLDKLHKQGALYIDNFNKIGYDRTLWYSVSDAVMKIYTTGKSRNYEPEPLKTDELAENWAEPPEAAAGGNPCPNGQMHAANSQNAFAQTGEWGENQANLTENEAFEPPEAETAGNSCPNGQMHVANSQNRSDENAKSIPQIRQIDSAESPDRFDENAPPIPDINISKPASDSEAAEKIFSRESLPELFLGIDRRFAFSEDFYEKALAVLNEPGLGEAYCRWLYRECLKMEPENMRGLYYTLFKKPEMAALFASSGCAGASGAAPPFSSVQCRACGAAFRGDLMVCPSCGMNVLDMPDELEVERHRCQFRR